MNTDTDNGLLLVLPGLPASGKDTIVIALLADSSLKLNRITTFATREIRKGEVNGDDYYFVSEEQFRLLQKKGHYLNTLNPEQLGKEHQKSHLKTLSNSTTAVSGGLTHTGVSEQKPFSKNTLVKRWRNNFTAKLSPFLSMSVTKKH